ncbi:prepilin-type N-terminal cleavage/methylation domain-containing protein [bacterium]|nr:prepilin-type N-terminal cleavage/methylation domain-containing protein [bacterium]
MKTEFKSKFLQHLSKKKSEEGFTLIELLVVIIIIGILAAIALPSFLNQAAKAKQSEAKNTVGSTNRAQQAYRLAQSAFATAFTDLASDVAIVSLTDNYTYQDIATSTATDAYITANPIDAQALKGYKGRVSILTAGPSSSGGAVAGACEDNNKGAPAVTVNIAADGTVTCTGGKSLSKG